MEKDLLDLLDQLEEVLTSGSKLWITGRTLVDESECLDIVDQIRVAVPEEVKAARRVSQDRDALIAQARAEAERMVRDAEQQLANRVSDHTLVRAAETRASHIEEEAQQGADEVRREADLYVYRVLERLRGQVEHIATAVDRGIDQLAVEDEQADRRA